MSTDKLGSATTLPASPARNGILWSSLAVVVMIACACGVFFLVSAHGAKLVAPPLSAADTAHVAVGTTPHLLLHVLIALAAVIVTGMALAKLFARIGQPPVIGELIAGIVLGPSLLGPELSALILPPAAAPTLGVIAQLGVVLYMFIIGLELHGDKMKERAPVMVAISQASIVLPFLCGAALALYVYPRLSNDSVPFTSFSLFMGVAMAVTAFPVLARILADTRLLRTEIGTIALSCAATADVTAWSLLAFVVGVAKAEIGEGILVAVGTLVFIAVMILLVRPVLRRVVMSWPADRLPRGAVAFVLVALILSALTTEAIGVHAIFGAFILGAVIPAQSAVARTFTREFEPLVTVLLLPAFFAYTGMRTRIDLVTEAEQWLVCGLIVVVSTIAKVGGTMIAARLTGLGWRPAAAIGTLMNTRGLMEIIVLNIGLELGIISPTLFAMMVMMAIVTTMATAPILRRLVPEAR
jgi:Kef-type K+ transport system membrane component KefB